MKKEKVYKSFKTYTIVMQEVWKFLTIILVGVLIGWLITRNSENKTGFVISIIIALVVALAVFFVSIIRISNKIKENENEKKTNKSSEENI